MTSTIEFNGIVDVLKPEHAKYEKAFVQIGEGFKLASEIFNDDDFEKKKGWKVDSESHGMTVHTKTYPFGKVFALTAQFAAPIETVFDVTVRDFGNTSKWSTNIIKSEVVVQLTDNVDIVHAQFAAPIETVFDVTVRDFGNTSKWSTNIIKSEVVVQLTDNVDIVHYANPDVMIVKSRDYVTGRIWRKIEDQYYIGARSVDVDDLKETKEHVRGKLHLGCGRLSPIGETRTQIEYLLCIDFKGLIPKTVVNAVMGKLVIKDFEETDKHLKEVYNKH
uniref:START domain-containing protein n=1 Tax=Panagrolaimus sp. JU765 TaxID=591449 RepID=A0AC34R145_9BILA